MNTSLQKQLNTTPEKHLTLEEVGKISSVYLNEGRKKDDWEILDVTVEGRSLTSRLRMCSTFVSPTDPAGFHLTIFSTLEFLSQLTIIYGHVWAGYTEKTREGWMVETSITCRQPIRDPENIQVHMDVVGIKRIRDKILAITQSQVFDDQGGLFEARLKGFMS